MRLPFAPPLAPMLSSAADALPGGEGWQFEPEWDGFRTLVFRDSDEILLQSRDEKPINRYFPELIAPLAVRRERLEPAEPHPDQFPNTGLPIRPFVDHREPLRRARAQRQNDPSS